MSRHRMGRQVGKSPSPHGGEQSGSRGSGLRKLGRRHEKGKRL